MLTNALQILCLLFTGAGIGIEIYANAHWGFALVTAGTALFAVSTKTRKQEVITANHKLFQVVVQLAETLYQEREKRKDV
jgi:ribosomal protein L23